MATAEQIAEVRVKIAEPLNSEPWTDEIIEAMIDASAGSTDAVAKTVWNSKAAQVAHLVDISEGGSSRKMSDMHKNFLNIAKSFETEAGLPEAAVRSSMTREITRA